MSEYLGLYPVIIIHQYFVLSISSVCCSEGKEQDRQRTCNVTLRRVSAIIVVVDMQ